MKNFSGLLWQRILSCSEFQLAWRAADIGWLTERLMASTLPRMCSVTTTWMDWPRWWRGGGVDCSRAAGCRVRLEAGSYNPRGACLKGPCSTHSPPWARLQGPTPMRSLQSISLSRPPSGPAVTWSPSGTDFPKTPTKMLLWPKTIGPVTRRLGMQMSTLKAFALTGDQIFNRLGRTIFVRWHLVAGAS